MVQVDYKDEPTIFGADEGMTVRRMFDSCRDWKMPKDVAAYLNEELVTDWETVLKDDDVLLFIE